MGLNETREQLEVLAQYSEPFNAECRAFGRLKESGHEDLAITCYGYLLLDEAHERTLMDRFKLSFDGNMDMAGWYDDLRPRFLCRRTGKPPPIRGILKGLGTAGLVNDPPNLTVNQAKRILRDTIKLQQLGIISLDVRRDQLIDNRFCDFSVAITVPHFLTTPELNPSLSPVQKSKMLREAFMYSISDYWNFEQMLMEAMDEKLQTSNLYDKVPVFPGGVRYTTEDKRHRLRSNSGKPDRVYTLVDPRGYSGRRSTTPVSNGTNATKSGGVTKTKAKPAAKSRQRKEVRVPLLQFPQKWYFNCTSGEASELNATRSLHTTLSWIVKGGRMAPRVF